MSSSVATGAVIVVSAALVGGGLFFTLGGSGNSEVDQDRSVATRPTIVAATPEDGTAVAGAPVQPVDTTSADTTPPISAIDDAETTVPAETAPATTLSATSTTTTVPATTVPVPVLDEDGTLPVPNVVGQSQAVAESRLANFDVEITVVDATESDDFDIITSQSPTPGARLPPRGLVSLELSVQPVAETVDADVVRLTDFDIVDRPAVVALDDGECAVLGPSDVVDPDGQRVLGFEPIDCDEPHDVQMISAIELQRGPDVFEVDAVTEVLRRECRPFFEDFVGVREFESRTFGLFTIRPEPERYDTEGDRTAFCMVLVTVDARVIGSAEGTLW